jgi:hypothetical protein
MEGGADAVSSSSSVREEGIAKLVAMGFDPSFCEAAYEQARGSGEARVERAVNMLLNPPMSGAYTPVEAVEHEPRALAEAQMETAPELGYGAFEDDLPPPPPPPAPFRPGPDQPPDAAGDADQSLEAVAAMAAHESMSPVATPQTPLALQAENETLKAENAALKEEVAELRRQLHFVRAAQQNVPHEQIPPVQPEGLELELEPEPEPELELEPEPEPELDDALTRTTTPQAIAKLQMLSPALREDALAQLVCRQADRPEDRPEAESHASFERFATEERGDEELQRPVVDSQELARLLPELGIRSKTVVVALRALGYVRVGELRRADDIHHELQDLLKGPDRRRLEKALADPREFPATHRSVSHAAGEARVLAEVPLRSFLSRVDLQDYSECLEGLGYRFLSDLLEALVDASVAEWRRSCKDKLDTLAEMSREQRLWRQSASAEQSHSCHVWQYEGDVGDGWMDMGIDQQLELTSKYLQHVPRFEMPPYTFDFTTMTQARANTSTVRKIQGITAVGKLQNLPVQLHQSIDRLLAVFQTDVERVKLMQAVTEHATAQTVATSDSDAALRSSASTQLSLLENGKPKHKEPRHFRLTHRGQLTWAKTASKSGKCAQVVGVSRCVNSCAFVIHKIDQTTGIASDLHVLPPDIVVRREWLFALAAVSYSAHKADIGAESSFLSPTRQSLSPIGATASPTAQSPKDAKRTEQALAALAETVADIAAGEADTKILTRRMVNFYQHSPALVAKTCEVLCQRSAADLRKAFTKVNGPDVVVRAFGVHAAETDVQKYGVALLKSIKSDPSVNKAIKNHGAKAAGTVAAALDSGGVDLAAAGSHTLQFLAKRPYPRVRDSIAEARGVVTVAKVMADYPLDRDVQRAGCRALRHMCTSEGHKTDENAQAVLHVNAHALAQIAQQQVTFQDDERLLKAARELIFRVPGKGLPREITGNQLVFGVELAKLDGSPEKNAVSKPKACRVYIGDRSIIFYSRDSSKKLREIMYIDINLDRAEGSKASSDFLTLKTKKGGVDAEAFRLDTAEAGTILEAVCVYHSYMIGEQERTKAHRIAERKRAEDVAAQTRRDTEERSRRIAANERAEAQERRRAADERQRAAEENRRRLDADVRREEDERMRLRMEQQKVQISTSRAREQALLSEQKAAEVAAQQSRLEAQAQELEATEAEQRRLSQEAVQQRLRSDMEAENQLMKENLAMERALIAQDQIRTRQLETERKKRQEQAKAVQAQAAHDKAVLEHRAMLVQMQQQIPVWQVNTDEGWVEYDGPDNIRITDAYKAQVQYVVVRKTPDATWWYELDLTKLVQVRTNPKTERKIRGLLGGGQMVPPLILPQIDVPDYWTHKSPGANAQIPNEFMKRKLEELMISSTYRGHINGCNSGRSMRGLQVTRCLRVENMKLWRAYCFSRESLREAAADHGYSTLSQRPEPAKFLSGKNSRVIDASINEYFLWHGTKPEIVDILAQHGFDERVASKSLRTATVLLRVTLLMSCLSQIRMACMALATTSQMQRASRISTQIATVMSTLTATGSMSCCIVACLWGRLT